MSAVDDIRALRARLETCSNDWQRKAVVDAWATGAAVRAEFYARNDHVSQDRELLGEGEHGAAEYTRIRAARRARDMYEAALLRLFRSVREREAARGVARRDTANNCAACGGVAFSIAVLCEDCTECVVGDRRGTWPEDDRPDWT